MLPFSKSLFRSGYVPSSSSITASTSCNITTRKFRRQFSAAAVSNMSTMPVRKELSPEEALFLAKEAGFYTKKELQEQIIRSPPFSTNSTPILMDTMFLKPFDDEVERVKAQMTPNQFPDDDDEELDSEYIIESIQNDPTSTLIPQKIHESLKRMSRNSDIPTFRDCRTGLEWLTKAEGQGTRARATAKVLIKRGSGIIKVNGEEDFTSRWPLFYNRLDICLPFLETHSTGIFDVFITVKGGGTSGQAGAARLAIARALYAARPSCLAELETRDLLFEDTRQVISKEAGLEKARKKYRWVKR